MQKELITQLHKNFEDCAHEKNGVEFWYARELQVLLGYDEWRNFEQVIQKAKIACENAKQSILDHFVDVNKMIEVRLGHSEKCRIGGGETNKICNSCETVEKLFFSSSSERSESRSEPNGFDRLTTGFRFSTRPVRNPISNGASSKTNI